MKEDDDGPPQYFIQKRDAFIEQCIELGLDVIDVKDFLEDKGLIEVNHEILLDFMKNRNYQNPLRRHIP